MRNAAGAARVLNIKYSHCCISSSRYDGTVVGMGHELDREDVLGMTGGDGGTEAELRGGVERMV